ncbi:MAG: hypothetical protein JW963_24210 [Anaerolineales bacterium]|nr:hypothetical protein [Anaerolineales bacterium]
MNKTLQTILIVSAVLVLGIGLFLGGMFFNRMQGWNSYGPGGMMDGYAPGNGQGYGPGDMMDGDGRGVGPGGMMGDDYGPGNMMGSGYGYDGQVNVEPLSVAETEQAVQDYLAYYKDDDLAIKEIMIFDNNSYAIITEKSTGIGAFELLVDPVAKTAYPEYGPNMMWNLKYGMHSGYGMMGGGGMMGNYQQSQNVDAEMPVSAEEAAKYGQDYLDKYQPGVTVSEEITPFYGYYTIDLEKDGQIVGMLSVNGYDGQVFYHSWHGTFIEMNEE